ncbi:MAG TPA: ribonuclease T [Woeseiaceae bacterium]|jgi:ribonuclease T|nr:ribonuclease T [Woeseiaceae bacterium]|tara:strand:+ start:35766 stop:36392 length:627 start_codon:yes stop_codon:yes gene_type:complete
MNNTHLFANRFRGYLPVVIDVETGGFNAKKDALLEIAAVLIDFNEDGTIMRGTTIRHHINPFEGSNLDPASLAINKIDPGNPLRLAIDEKEALNDIFIKIHEIMKEFKCKRTILVGHNAAFDLNFINAAIARCSIKHNPFHSFSCFDTATLCGVAYGHTVLAKAVEIAGFNWDASKAHSAAYDAEKTADLFCDIVNRFNPIYKSFLDT